MINGNVIIACLSYIIEAYLLYIICAIAPSDAPQHFNTTTLTSTSVTLTWSPPSIPNGVITNYNISIDGKTRLLNSSDSVYTAERLNENTNFTFSIAALTAIGQGPDAVLTVATLEDGE